jgi:hypothetical protein
MERDLIKASSASAAGSEVNEASSESTPPALSSDSKSKVACAVYFGVRVATHITIAAVMKTVTKAIKRVLRASVWKSSPRLIVSSSKGC